MSADIRLACLTVALQLRAGGTTPEDIIAIATKFYDFANISTPSQAVAKPLTLKSPIQNPDRKK